MDTKEKVEIKKNKNEFDDIFILSVILLANIFYTLPLALSASKAVPMNYLIYIVFPVLIAVISTIYGYMVEKDLKLSVIMYVLVMPSLILIGAQSGDLTYNISYLFIIAFGYFALSIAATAFGEYTKRQELLEKSKEKKKIKSKAKATAKKEKVNKN